MKKYSFQLTILPTLVLTIGLFGCSKDKTLLSKTTKEATVEPVINSGEKIALRGSVTGMILPLETEVKIAVYNRDFIITDFYYPEKGTFRLDKIPAGVYTVLIINVATDQRFSIPSVRVSYRYVTNIGLFKF